jgi:hypothetical protein
LGARRKLSPIVWAIAVRTLDLELGGFGCEQDVVAAAGDLAGDSQSRAAAAAALDGAGVEVVVGAAVTVAVVGRFDQGPPEVL